MQEWIDWKRGKLRGQMPALIAITPIAEAHLIHVQRHASHPDIGATSNVPSPFPEDGASQWFQTVSARVAAGQSQVFAASFDRAFCGVIALNAINRELGSAQLDYWIAVPFQRRGIATQAAALAISQARTSFNARVLLSSCLTMNTASARVLERNGFFEYARERIDGGKFHGHELRRFRLRAP